jgi:hypothetical protein
MDSNKVDLYDAPALYALGIPLAIGLAASIRDLDDLTND